MSDPKMILSKCFNLLGLPRPDMKDFDERLRLQKTVYLLWANGISLGYGFNWYVRGPYSPQLASDGYALSDELFEESKNITLNNEESIIESLNKFKEILGDKIDDSLYLEILASLHYIKKVAFRDRDDFEGISNWLKKHKPYLKNNEGIDQMISSAYEQLKYFNN
jgi:uncharacterized protein YwgA